MILKYEIFFKKKKKKKKKNSMQHYNYHEDKILICYCYYFHYAIITTRNELIFIPALALSHNCHEKNAVVLFPTEVQCF